MFGDFVFVAHRHGPDSQLREFLDWKSILGQMHLPDIGRLVEIRGIANMRIEIDIAPTGLKDFRVHVSAIIGAIVLFVA